MHVDQVFGSASASANLCQERFSINQIVSRDTCKLYNVYMYTSRVQVSLASVRSCGDNISIGEEWSPALA